MPGACLCPGCRSRGASLRQLHGPSCHLRLNVATCTLAQNMLFAKDLKFCSLMSHLLPALACCPLVARLGGYMPPSRLSSLHVPIPLMLFFPASKDWIGWQHNYSSVLFLSL